MQSASAKSTAASAQVQMDTLLAQVNSALGQQEGEPYHEQIKGGSKKVPQRGGAGSHVHQDRTAATAAAVVAGGLGNEISPGAPFPVPSSLADRVVIPSSPMTPLYNSPTSTSTETLQSVSPFTKNAVAGASALRCSSSSPGRDRRRTTTRRRSASGGSVRTSRYQKDHHPVGVGIGAGDGGAARGGRDNGGIIGGIGSRSRSLSVSWADDVVDKTEGSIGRARKVKHKMKDKPSPQASPHGHWQEWKATKGAPVPPPPPPLGQSSGKQEKYVGSVAVANTNFSGDGRKEGGVGVRSQPHHHHDAQAGGVTEDVMRPPSSLVLATATATATTATSRNPKKDVIDILRRHVSCEDLTSPSSPVVALATTTTTTKAAPSSASSKPRTRTNVVDILKKHVRSSGGGSNNSNNNNNSAPTATQHTHTATKTPAATSSSSSSSLMKSSQQQQKQQRTDEMSSTQPFLPCNTTTTSTTSSITTSSPTRPLVTLLHPVSPSSTSSPRRACSSTAAGIGRDSSPALLPSSFTGERTFGPSFSSSQSQSTSISPVSANPPNNPQQPPQQHPSPSQLAHRSLGIRRQKKQTEQQFDTTQQFPTAAAAAPPYNNKKSVVDLSSTTKTASQTTDNNTNNDKDKSSYMNATYSSSRKSPSRRSRSSSPGRDKKSPPRKGPQSLYEISLFYKTPVHVLVTLNPHLQYIVDLSSGDGAGSSSSVASKTKLSMFEPLPKGTKVTLPAGATKLSMQGTATAVPPSAATTTETRGGKQQRQRHQPTKEVSDTTMGIVDSSVSRMNQGGAADRSTSSSSSTERRAYNEQTFSSSRKIRSTTPKPREREGERNERDKQGGEVASKRSSEERHREQLAALDEIEREREQWRSLQSHVKEASEGGNRRKVKLLQKRTSTPITDHPQQQQQYAHVFSFPSFNPPSTHSLTTLSHQGSSGSYVPTTTTTSLLSRRGGDQKGVGSCTGAHSNGGAAVGGGSGDNNDLSFLHNESLSRRGADDVEGSLFTLKQHESKHRRHRGGGGVVAETAAAADTALSFASPAVLELNHYTSSSSHGGGGGDRDDQMTSHHPLTADSPVRHIHHFTPNSPMMMTSKTSQHQYSYQYKKQSIVAPSAERLLSTVTASHQRFDTQEGQQLQELRESSRQQPPPASAAAAPMAAAAVGPRDSSSSSRRGTPRPPSRLEALYRDGVQRNRKLAGSNGTPCDLWIDDSIRQSISGLGLPPPHATLSPPPTNTSPSRIVHQQQQRQRNVSPRYAGGATTSPRVAFGRTISPAHHESGSRRRQSLGRVQGSGGQQRPLPRVATLTPGTVRVTRSSVTNVIPQRRNGATPTINKPRDQTTTPSRGGGTGTTAAAAVTTPPRYEQLYRDAAHRRDRLRKSQKEMDKLLDERVRRLASLSTSPSTAQRSSSVAAAAASATTTPRLTPRSSRPTELLQRPPVRRSSSVSKSTPPLPFSSSLQRGRPAPSSTPVTTTGIGGSAISGHHTMRQNASSSSSPTASSATTTTTHSKKSTLSSTPTSHGHILQRLQAARRSNGELKEIMARNARRSPSHQQQHQQKHQKKRKQEEEKEEITTTAPPQAEDLLPLDDNYPTSLIDDVSPPRLRMII